MFCVFPGGSEVKASACNLGDLSSIPGLGRSPGEGNDNPLQYSCLENPMDEGAWWATVHGSQRIGHDWATSLSLCVLTIPKICHTRLFVVVIRKKFTKVILRYKGFIVNTKDLDFVFWCLSGWLLSSLLPPVLSSLYFPYEF